MVISSNNIEPTPIVELTMKSTSTRSPFRSVRPFTIVNIMGGRLNSTLLPLVAICLTITTYLVLNQTTSMHIGGTHTKQGQLTFTVQHEGSSFKLRAASTTSDVALKEAIAAAVDYQLRGSLDTFSLVGADEELLAISVDTLGDGQTYKFKPNKQSYFSHDDEVQRRQDTHNTIDNNNNNINNNNNNNNNNTIANGIDNNNNNNNIGQEIPTDKLDELKSLVAQHGIVANNDGKQPLNDDSIVLTRKPATFPRAVVACLGTARYRYIAIEALKSAREHFGGDCLVSLHLLTDNVSGVDPEFNPSYAPYREWPQSGLSKFEDILDGLGIVIAKADYFFFIDGDVKFKEDVLLADVAADLMAVEHPFYPRNIMGFCTPDKASGRGFCGYPYDRNPKSQIQVPEGSGRYFVKIEDPTHKIDPYYIVKSNSWYIQSAFWGGKSKHVIPLLDDLKKRVNIDRSNHVYSQVVQDERYLNWYLWKHGNDSDLNIRILKPSYLYPYNDHGFGDHIRKQARPIIVHGTAKPGKMIKGEVEIRLHGTSVCFDNFLKEQIGTYNCHHESRKGGSQGFIYTVDDNRLRVQWGKSGFFK